jgi:hypothetical protein
LSRPEVEGFGWGDADHRRRTRGERRGRFDRGWGRAGEAGREHTGDDGRFGPRVRRFGREGSRAHQGEHAAAVASGGLHRQGGPGGGQAILDGQDEQVLRRVDDLALPGEPAAAKGELDAMGRRIGPDARDPVAGSSGRGGRITSALCFESVILLGW